MSGQAWLSPRSWQSDFWAVGAPRRLKRPAAIEFLFAVAAVIVSLMLVPLSNDIAFVPLAFFGVAAMSGVFWCYVAFAIWLTRDASDGAP
jgi:hypothetical protein